MKSLTKYRKKRNNGYALITIIVIGSFAIVFLMALANITTSAVRVSAENKWAESLRAAAEIGIDYAVNSYNSDPTYALDQNTTANPFPLPASYLQSGTANSGIPNVTVQIAVSKITDWTTFAKCSSIYSPMLDPTLPLATMGYYGGGYRIILSSATNGVYTKTIRVILKGRLDTPPDGNVLLQGGGQAPRQSYFSTPFLSNGTISLNSPSLLVQGFNTQAQATNPLHQLSTPNGTAYAAYDLNVTTNTSASISAGSVIAGDLSVMNPKSVTTAVSMQSSSIPTVDGRVFMNSASPSVNGPAGITLPTDANVVANADSVAAQNPLQQRLGYNAQLPSVVNSPVASQTTIAPTPTSSNGPAQASPLPPVEATQTLPSLASLSQTQTAITSVNQTTGATGNYSLAGLSTDGVSSNQPIQIQNATAPVAFYVADSTSSSISNPNAVNAVSLDTSLILTQNSDPRNLQIYYGGNEPVNLNISGGKAFNGLIYAPNAPVTISGTGNFLGAIVGGSVNVTLNGTLSIATDLSVSNANTPTGWAAPMSGAAQAAIANRNAGVDYLYSPNGPVIQGWQPVTWQEL